MCACVCVCWYLCIFISPVLYEKIWKKLALNTFVDCRKQQFTKKKNGF